MNNCRKCNKLIPDKRNLYYCNNCASNLNRISAIRRKIKVLEIVGSSCMCCGIKEWWNLEVDHIEPKKYKEGVRYRSYIVYNGIIDGSLNPKDFQTLCSGCNRSKSFHSACMLPHNYEYYE